MKLYGNDVVVGNKVKLQSSHEMHYKVKTPKESDDSVVKSFGSLLSGAFGKVNKLQMSSDKLNKKMVTNPESVSIHSVMIAAQKAEMALAFTKAITDRVIRAYKEITNLR